MNVTCAGDFTDKKQGAITAVATIIIALFTAILGSFTIGLARATKIAAIAAKQNAQGLINDAERAHLYPIMKSENLTKELTAVFFYTSNPEMDEGFVPNQNVEFTIKNLGRTPGVIIDLSYSIIQAAPSNATWNYSANDVPYVAINGGDELPDLRCRYDGPFRLANAKLAANGTEPLFFYGRAIYMTAFQREYICSWRYRNSGRRFVLEYYEDRAKNEFA